MWTEQGTVGLRAFIDALALSQIQGMRREPCVGLSEPVGAVARPAILGGIGDHLRPNGGEFYVAVTSQQVGFSLNDARLVTPFPQAAGAPVEAVDVLNLFSSVSHWSQRMLAEKAEVVMVDGGGEREGFWR